MKNRTMKRTAIINGKNKTIKIKEVGYIHVDFYLKEGQKWIPLEHFYSPMLRSIYESLDEGEFNNFINKIYEKYVNHKNAWKESPYKTPKTRINIKVNGEEMEFGYSIIGHAYAELFVVRKVHSTKVISFRKGLFFLKKVTKRVNTVSSKKEIISIHRPYSILSLHSIQALYPEELEQFFLKAFASYNKFIAEKKKSI